MSNLDLDKIKKVNNGQSNPVHYCNKPAPVNNIPVENCVKIPHNCNKPLTIVNLTAIELAAIAGVLEKIIKLLQGLKSDTDSLSECTENITRELAKTALEETLITSTENILEKILDVRLPEDTLDSLAKESTLNLSTQLISNALEQIYTEISNLGVVIPISSDIIKSIANNQFDEEEVIMFTGVDGLVPMDLESINQLVSLTLNNINIEEE